MFAELRMEHYLAVTMARISALDPQQREGLANLDRWMTEQGVVSPERIAGMLAPGAWA